MCMALEILLHWPVVGSRSPSASALMVRYCEAQSMSATVTVAGATTNLLEHEDDQGHIATEDAIQRAIRLENKLQAAAGKIPVRMGTPRGEFRAAVEHDIFGIGGQHAVDDVAVQHIAPARVRGHLVARIANEILLRIDNRLILRGRQDHLDIIVVHQAVHVAQDHHDRVVTHQRILVTDQAISAPTPPSAATRLRSQPIAR